MAKQLLLHILSNIVGKYVDGINADNLQVGIWNGEIELHNLSLKPSALDSLHLPIVIDRATIKKLKLTIPWGSLTSKAVVVEIDGVLVQASPLDVNTLSVDDAKAALRAAKRAKLHNVGKDILEELSRDQDMGNDMSKSSYVQILVAKIIDNLEVSITNVHVRYEDRSSLQLSRFACGLTLSQISLSTTDSNWQKRFMDKEGADLGSSTYKLGRVVQLGLYWNSSGCQLSSRKTAQEWEEYMLALIHASGDAVDTAECQRSAVRGSELEPMSYLLHPRALLNIRMIDNKRSTASKPKIDVVTESSALQFRLNEAQYGQIKALEKVFADLEYRKVMMTFRPAKRPTEDPRAWWRYAYQCITGSDSKSLNRMEVLIRNRKAKGVYVPHCTRAFIFTAVRSEFNTKGQLPTTAPTAVLEPVDVEKSIAQLEDEVDLTTLANFRIFAARAAVEQVKAMRVNPQLLAKYVESCGLIKPGQQMKLSQRTNKTPATTTTAAAAAESKSDEGKAAGGEGWWGWWSGSKSKESQRQESKVDAAKSTAVAAEEKDEIDEEDQQLMQDIKTKIKEATDAAKADSQAGQQEFLLRVNLFASASLLMEYAGASTVRVNVATRAIAEKKADSFALALQLGDVFVEDLVTAAAVSKYLVSSMPTSGTALAADIAREGVLLFGDAHIHDKQPQVHLSVKIQDGRTAVKMSTLPLKVTFNEQCVHQLLKFLSTSPPKNTYTSYGIAAQSPLLVENMKKFSTNMVLPSGWTDIDLAVAAPTFVIPERSDDPRAGCLILDTGELKVQGTLGPTGMKWSIALEEVNAALLDSIEQLIIPEQDQQKQQQLRTAKIDYLVTPFTLRVEVQNVDKQYANLQIDGWITPSVSARLNVEQLFRVLAVVDNVSVAMRTDSAPPPSGSSGSISSSDSTPSRKINTEPSVHELPVDSLAEVNGEVTTMSVTFRLPSVNLAFNISKEHSIELAFLAIKSRLMKRAFDTTVQLSVQSVALDDSTRPTDFKSLICSTGASVFIDDVKEAEISEEEGTMKTKKKRPKLLTIMYRSITSPLSSLFDRNQTELSVVSVGLSVMLDDITFKRYSVLSAQFMKRYRIYSATRSGGKQRQQQQQQQQQRDVEAPDEQSTAPVLPPPAFGNQTVQLHIERMALCLLQATNDLPQHHTPVNAHEMESSPQRLSILHPQQSSFETAFEIVVTGISAKLSVEEELPPSDKTAPSSDDSATPAATPGGKVNKVTASLISFEIVDSRKGAADKPHRKLISASPFVDAATATEEDSTFWSPRSNDGFSSPDPIPVTVPSSKSVEDSEFFDAIEGPDEVSQLPLSQSSRVRFDSIAISIASFRTALSNSQKTSAAATAQRRLLTLSLTQHTVSGQQDIAVKMLNITTTVSVESVQSLVELIQRNLTALQMVANSLRDDTVSGNSSKLQQESKKQQQQLKKRRGSLNQQVPGSLTVRVEIEDPLLLLLEDPSNAFCNAVGSDCSIRFDFNRRHTKIVANSSNGGGDIIECRDIAFVALSKARVFLTDMSDLEVDQCLIDSVDVELTHATTKRDDAVVSTEIALFGRDDINCNLSLHGIALASRIVANAMKKPAVQRPMSHESSTLPPPLNSRKLNRWTGNQSEIVDNSCPSSSDTCDFVKENAHEIEASETAPSGSSSSSQQQHQQQQSIVLTSRLVVNFPSVSACVVDDLGAGGMNTPVVKVTLNSVLFVADTEESGAIESDPSFCIEAKYFNTRNHSWEPLVEKFYPAVRYHQEKKNATTRLTVAVPGEVRINLTGALLSSVRGAIDRLAKLQAQADVITGVFRKTGAQLMIHNELGVPIQIYDSMTKERLLLLDSDVPVDVPYCSADIESDDTSSGEFDSAAVTGQLRYPDAFDIHLTGVAVQQRLPILHVPSSPSRPRHYQFLLNPHYQSTAPATTNAASSRRMRIKLPSQPIIEEVFENSRFNRITFHWSAPYTSLGDPPRWTDRKLQPRWQYDSSNGSSSGDGVLRPSSSAPPPVGWGWVEPDWAIDMSGRVGEEIDGEGWEYAASGFKKFASAHSRRTQRSLDSVRRRRWVRSRYPLAVRDQQEGDALQRTLPVSWHVRIQDDESRLIHVTSGVLITNKTDSVLEIDMVESMLAREDKEVDIVIKPNETVAVPIFLASGSSLRLRPQILARATSVATTTSAASTETDVAKYSWSESVLYRRKLSDSSKKFSDMYQVQCNLAQGGSFRASMHLDYSDGIFQLTCSASAEVYNRLPGALAVTYMTSWVTESRRLDAGALLKLTCVDIKQQGGVNLIFAVDGYEGSLLVDDNVVKAMDETQCSGEREIERTLVLSARDDVSRCAGEKLVLTALIRISTLHVLQIFVFSKYLLVDRSNIALIVRSSYFDNDSKKLQIVQRSTGTSMLSAAAAADTVADALQLSEPQQQLLLDGTAGAGSDAAGVWSTGEYGVAYFQPDKDDIISLGIMSGDVWMEDLALNALGAAKVSIAIPDSRKKRCYHLALQATSLQGAFASTKVLTVMPGIMLVNCLDQSIELFQVSKDGNRGQMGKSFAVHQESCRAWKSQLSDLAPTTVRLKSAFSGLSFGTVDLNEVGCTQLVLPSKHRDGFDSNSGLVIVNVEVKLSQPTEASYITVVFWQALIDRNSDGSINTSTVALSVRNQTNLPLVMRQKLPKSASSTEAASSDSESRKFDLCLAAGQWLPYGWRDPDAGTTLLLSIGSIRHDTASSAATAAAVCEFDMLADFGKEIKVPIPKLNCAAATAVLDAETRSKLAQLEDGDIRLVVEVLGNGFDVRVFNAKDEEKAKALSDGSLKQRRWQQQQQQHSQCSSVAVPSSLLCNDLQNVQYSFVEVKLSWLSVSMIADCPKRREFFCWHFDTVNLLHIKMLDSTDGYYEEIDEFKVQNFQIDNFSESLVYPVLLHSYDRREQEEKGDTRRAKKKKAALRSQHSIASIGEADVDRAVAAADGVEGGEDGHSQASSDSDEDSVLLPFLHISVIQAKPRTGDATHIKSLSVRLLELNLSVDSSSVILLFLDLLSDLSSSNRISITDSSFAEFYISDYNRTVLSTQLAGTGDAVLQMSDVYQQVIAARKNFIEVLNIHPIKVKVRFLVTPFPRQSLRAELRQQRALSWLSALQTAATIDGALIRVNSFSTRTAMVTMQQLVSMIVENTVQGLRDNLVSLIGSVFGSLHVLGKPAGLYKKLGNGVQDFFYEPYQGAMESPSHFVLGVGIGTTALASEVASGIACSAATIVGSVSEGFSGVASAALLGHDDYKRKRDERRRLERLENKGLTSGLRTGAENVLGGFASGITGIVKAPIEQGRKGGALGFVKGIGIGLVGAAVKPALGLSDGLAAVAAGFNHSVDEDDNRQWLRPPRAFERSLHNPRQLLLVEFVDLFAAHAQQVIHARAYRGKYSDNYEASSLLSTAGTAAFRRMSVSKWMQQEIEHASNAPHGVAVSSKSVLLLTAAFEVISEMPFHNISHIKMYKLLQQRSCECVVEIVLYDSPDEVTAGATGKVEKQQDSNRRLLHCATIEDGTRVFAVLFRFADKMGNPAQCSSMNMKVRSKYGGFTVVTDDADNSASAATIAAALGDCNFADSDAEAAALDVNDNCADRYEFGALYNGCFVPKERGNNEQIIDRALRRFISVRFDAAVDSPETAAAAIAAGRSRAYSASTGQQLTQCEYYNTMDRLVCLLIADWKNNHNFILNPSRCAACLIINASRMPVQIAEVTLKEGLDSRIFAVGSGYNVESQSLLADGGAAVVFAFGKKPSLLNLAHVKVKVFTSACLLTVSTRSRGAWSKNKDGWRTSFREKTQKDMWSKFVLVIEDTASVAAAAPATAATGVAGAL